MREVRRLAPDLGAVPSVIVEVAAKRMEWNAEFMWVHIFIRTSCGKLLVHPSEDCWRNLPKE